MKAKSTSNNHDDDPLDRELDLSKLQRLGRLGEMGKVVSCAALEPRNIKVDISIKLDADVLEWFKSTGPGYQTRMNAVLRAFKEAAV